MSKSNLLTVTKISHLKEPGRYCDGGGLYLQISRWHTKAWIFRFERDGRERHMGLGPTDIVTLADARERARAARLLLLDGHDPIDVRKAKKNALRVAAAKTVTFRECSAGYIKAHGPAWRNAKHAAQWRSTLDRYAEPIIGKLPVAAVDTNLVLQVLEPIWVGKTATANRLRGRIEKILDWAKVRGFRDGDNPARWQGHLDKLLARPSKVAPIRHRPALPFAELPSFIADLQKREGMSARSLEFLILTVARTSEVIGARWCELDVAKKIWTVPGARMKSGRDHRVPLSEPSLAILKTLHTGEPDEFVFLSRDAKPLSNMAMLELLRDMRPGPTVHGFRSTFKDWAAETTRHANIVSEMALAHAIDDDTEAAYRRGDLFDKRRLLMRDWAVFCKTPITERTVVAIGDRRRHHV